MFFMKADSTIVQTNNSILASKKDRKIFFDAIINPPKPNKNLIGAAKKYPPILFG